MNGIEVKKKLKKSGYLLKNVAELMGETPQNLNSMLNAKDIKTGVIEKIASAIKKPLYFFFDDDKHVNDVNDVNGSNINLLLTMLKEKDDELTKLRAENDELKKKTLFFTN
ncbi:MAG: hypothetical protein LBE11_06900 [Prevotellaceae bacterium]|jgi:transcriptional regulator with XRE-family HTH domain|nr:hypothetical protein [Prevotellaceae bacterium]